MQNPPYWDRFWEKVDASGDCWEWTANRHSQGYGKFNLQGKTVMAHRVAWELLVGPIPEGLTIDHLCRNEPCVNPDHLEPVTMQANLLRGSNFVAQNARKTECLLGHPLVGDNVFVAGRNARFCRTCHRRRSRESARAKRLADTLT
jgi:hypothetical protein